MDRQGGRSFFFGSKERAALNDGQICSARPATRTQKVSVFWLLISHVLKRVNPPFLVGSHSHLRMVLIGYLVDHGISYLFLEVCWQFFLGWPSVNEYSYGNPWVSMVDFPSLFVCLLEAKARLFVGACWLPLFWRWFASVARAAWLLLWEPSMFLTFSDVWFLDL